MKHEKLLTAFTAWVLAFFTAWGAVGCLTSAFDLTLRSPENMILICGLAALISAALFSLRYGWAAVLCLLALAGGYLWEDGTAARQLWQLLHHLTTIYDRAYGCGVLIIPEDMMGETFFDWPLGILGAWIAVTVSRSVCRRKSVWLPVLSTLLPLCACIVVTDTVPGERWLLMVMAGLILLILTSAVRRENSLQGLRLTVMAALPVTAALMALFAAVPQQGYVNQSEILRENILLAVQDVPKLLDTGMTQLASSLQRQPPKQVDLADLGARIPFTYPVMEVSAQETGTLYLRDQDYDGYDGLGWTAGTDREEAFDSPDGRTETITIRTESRKNIRYLPYYPAGETSLTDGAAENPEGEQEYVITRTHLPEDWRLTACRTGTASDAWPRYLNLPEATRREAEALLAGLYPEGASNTEKADVIAALVIDSGEYDLNSEKMPPSEGDFALWFLRDGERGYCVHFATAAAVLLRAAGVPARYVTGYMLEAEAGQAVTVTEENAHAWAEYYEPNLNVWIPLEATPAEEVPETPTAPRPTAAPETVMPTETTAPAVTEAVTEASLPPETTAPTISEPVPEASEVPEAPEAPEEPAEPVKIPVWLPLLPLLALILAAQRSARLALRRRLQRRGDPNRQALYRWREAVRLARLLKESPTEELIVLAQKAKFSQHELTAEELQLFDSFSRTCLRKLREKPWYLRLIYRYIYAAY